MAQNLTYTRCGDYLIPDIRLSYTSDKPLGKYGRMRRAYLEQNNPMLLDDLILTETLFPHLWKIDEIAHCRMERLTEKDLKNLAEELRETERQLSKLDEGRKNNMIAIRDLEMTKERLLSFAEYAKDAQPEVLVTLIQTIVERIYIVDKDDERYCHIFIKGCSGEDYTGFFQTAGYIEQNTVPVCDSEQYCICTKISERSNIWTNSGRYREHPKKTVRV